MQRPGRVVVALSGLVILINSGCGLPNPSNAAPSILTEPVPTTEILPTSETPGPLTPTIPPNEAEEPTGPEQIVLTLWTLPTFAPTAEVAGGDTLLEQLSTFDEANPGIRLEIYVKRTTGPGSTLDYLRTAPPVAPGVLPDLALLDQESVVQAARESLIVPMDGLLRLDSLGDLYPVAASLALVDEQLAGIPYALEVRHTVYRQTLFADPPNSFDLVLDSPTPYNFFIGPPSGVNQVTLLQYLAAGGRLTDEEGAPMIDANVLTSVLSFYSAAREAGTIDPAFFQYADTAEVWTLYRDGRINLADVSSTLYLTERDQVRSTGLTWAPTPTGEPFALARSWSWVMVTRDPERQQAALALLSFLMEPANQGAYTYSAHYLPSQRDALAVWGQGDPYVPFATTLLDHAQPLPEAAVLAAVGPPMQDAVESVMLNRIAPVQAALTAAQVLNPPESTP